jgi:gliding motility-associated-like protein
MKLGIFRLSLLLIAILPFTTNAQRGKNSDYAPIANNTVVNTYTAMTAVTGANTITVANNVLTNAVLTSPLAPGDLILIIQMQGAYMDIDNTATVGYGGNYTTPFDHIVDWPLFIDLWGQVLNPNNAGKFEQAEVRAVGGTTSITLQCNLVNSYAIAGKVQIVRIPRFNNLIVNTNTSIVPSAWNGTTGGIVAVEVNGTLSINGTGKISASALGFRGGVVQTSTSAESGVTAVSATNTNPTSNGSSFLGSNLINQGARKGEGIGGYTTEYALVSSEFGRGAPANGGGGGGIKNAGGGGGANVGAGTYTGKGVPNAAYAAAWALETGMGAASSGGGRGGYSYSASDQNPATLGPNQNAWSGDRRKSNGGLGGHPLVYDATRLYMGGGGGAGESDNASQGGAGGAGGGIVFITTFGTITGNGSIESDGAVGQKTNPLFQAVTSFTKKGNDGAGGAGAGGSIYIKNTAALPNTITINARGGVGGNHDLTYGTPPPALEATGPGGGGGGGNIAFTSGTPVQTVTGGLGGTSNSPHVNEFPPNGATGGAAGVTSLPTTAYNITASGVTICGGNSTTLTATATGTPPGTLTWYNAQFGGSTVGSGTTFTTPVLTTTTTYYVGTCPGTFRIPVTVTVNPAPVISGIPVITNAGCTTPGGITGLSASGGSGSYTYSWNATTTPSAVLSNASAGSYTLTVLDVNGCSTTSGPYTISGTSGPTINSASAVVSNQLCNGTMGSISGLTTTGNIVSYTWTNSGGSVLNPTGLPQGAYTLTVTDNVGCTATAGPFNVGFVAGPTINSTNVVLTDELCNGTLGSITGLTTTGTIVSYTWTNSGGSVLNPSALTQGIYSITVTDNNGCTASAGPFSIGYVAGPTLNATNVVITDEICNGTLGTISGITSTGTIVSYTWTGSTSTLMNPTDLTQGTYTLTATDNIGCQATAGPFTVGFVAGPTVNSTNLVIANELCNGTLGSISGLTATGTSLTYLWTNSGGSVLNPSSLPAGTYSLIVTDGNGCTANAGPFLINPAAGLSIDNSAMVVTQTSCTANTGSISGITINGGTNPVISWSNGASTANISNLAVGTYVMTVTDAAGCSDQISVDITMVNAPIIDITNLVVVSSHCAQSDGSINGITVSGGTPVYSYLWNGSTALSTLDISSIPVGSYNLVVTDSQGCSDSETVTITDIAGPTVSATNLVVTQPTCTGPGQILGLTVSGVATPYTYAWTNTAQTTIDITALNPASYTLTVTDNAGCTVNYGPIVLNAPTGPIAIFTWNPLIPDLNETIAFDNTTAGVAPLVYTWTIDGQTFSTENISYAFGAEGTYPVTLSVIDANGCVDETTQVISVFGVLVIPNVITPNNDGNNDLFVIDGLKPESKLLVVNRWGNVVFETDDYQNDWNGKDLNGLPLLDGVYTYTLTTPDDNVKHGFIHLLR